jgi:hypothetical protein
VTVTYNGLGAPTNAGDYAVVASLSNDDYEAPNATGTLSIGKATSTTTVTFENGPYTYRGTAFTATAVATGAGGLSSTVSVVYSGDCTNVTSPNGCTATATYAESANHQGSTGNASITITKANPTITLTANDATYTGNPYAGATASCRGRTERAAHAGDAGLPGYGHHHIWSSSVAPTNSGTYVVRAHLLATANYNAAQASANFTINKAASTTVVTFEPAPYTYRGTAFIATAVATGAWQLECVGSRDLRRRLHQRHEFERLHGECHV